MPNLRCNWSPAIIQPIKAYDDDIDYYYSILVNINIIISTIIIIITIIIVVFVEQYCKYTFQTIDINYEQSCN